jgi:hypothetical protein
MKGKHTMPTEAPPTAETRAKTTIQATPELRELLLRYFAEKKSNQKPLNDQEYGKIRNLLDRRQGGLTREAYEAFKGDKDVVKAAAIGQIHRDHRIMDAKSSEVRPVLLKALKGKPGEKPLSEQEFKKVAIFLDRKNGGIRRHAFEIFKDDKEIVEAAQKHREAWQANAQGKAPEAFAKKEGSTAKGAASPPEPASPDKETPARRVSKGNGKLREFIEKRCAGAPGKVPMQAMEPEP